MDRRQVLQGSRSKSWAGNMGLALGRPGGAALWGGGEGTNERRGVGHGLGKPDVHDEWEKGRGTGEGARPRTPGT